MDDNKKKSGWDSLIEDLGVQPEETAYERHQPEEQTIESTDVQELAPTPEAKPGDWNALASTLGLEVDAVEPPAESKPPVTKPPKPVAAQTKKEKPTKESAQSESFGGFLAEEAPKEVPKKATEAEVETEDLPPLPSQIDQALSESSWDDESDDSPSAETSESAAEAESGDGISGEAARSAFDALFSDGASGWGSAFLAPGSKKEEKPAEQSEDLSDPLNAKAEAPGEEEESDRPKRKRSRRRRRGGRGRKPAGERTGEEVASTEGSESVAERDGSEAEASTEETKKPRRRRSRGGARRPGAEEEVVRDDDDSVDDLSSLDDDLDDDSDDDLDDDTNDELGEPSEAGQRRTKHRSIPAWSEAIGMIVDANLEQRAKSPSRPQSSRGGRGGRGGRRRRKPESN